MMSVAAFVALYRADFAPAIAHEQGKDQYHDQGHPGGDCLDFVHHAFALDGQFDADSLTVQGGGLYRSLGGFDRCGEVGCRCPGLGGGGSIGRCGGLLDGGGGCPAGDCPGSFGGNLDGLLGRGVGRGGEFR
jgi:hypothetical protein